MKRASRLVLTVALALAGFGAASADESPDGPRLAVSEFQKHVTAYMTLRKKLVAGLGPQKSTASPQVIAARTQLLAGKIRAARANAKVGQIFTPPVAAEFHRLIGLTMQGKEADQIRASLKSAEPVKVPLRVNGPYPTAVPLQSTPPSLLLNLPELPKEIDYRVVGRTLILRDVDANLILDFIPDVVD
jgi:hypothetical protein